MPVKVASKLKCRYADRGSPFLRLARVKEEEAYLKPLILIYHDIIYDAEIETIKKLSIPRVCFLFFLSFLFLSFSFLFLSFFLFFSPLFFSFFNYIQGVTGGTDQTSGGCSLC